MDTTQFLGQLQNLAKVAREAAVKRMNRDGTVNRMPYFFKLLDERITRLAAEWAKEDELNQIDREIVARQTAWRNKSPEERAAILAREQAESDAFNRMPAEEQDRYFDLDPAGKSAQVARYMPGGDCYVD